MSNRDEFTRKTKAAAALRANGHCEECGRWLRTGDWFYEKRNGDEEYDHQIACGLGGDNSVSNCVVLCKSCHAVKTKKDRKVIAKAQRNFRKSRGIKKARTITRWRRFDGSIVIAPRER